MTIVSGCAATTPAAPPFATADVDRALVELRATREQWHAQQRDERIVILSQVAHDLAAVEERWVGAALLQHGLRPDGEGERQERLAFAAATRGVRLLIEALHDIEAYGAPRIAGGLARRGGQLAARVFPASVCDRLAYPGQRGEVWLEPGLTAQELPLRQAWAYGDRPRETGVALVLADDAMPLAGVLHQLFVDDNVVALRLSPSLAYLGPVVEAALHALIGRHFACVLYGDAELDRYLARHPAIDTLQRTGPAAGGAPTIVVPGAWSDDDVQRRGCALVDSAVRSLGCDEAGLRLVIVPRGWRRRDALLAAVERALARVPPRIFPAARERQAELLAAYPRARRIGLAGYGRVPSVLLPDLGADDVDELLGGLPPRTLLLAELPLDAPTTAGFVERAVELINERGWGRDAATILVHPRELRDRCVRAAFERSLAGLEAPTVTVNCGPPAARQCGLLPRGSAGEGGAGPARGRVDNPLMLPRVQKSVMYGPFRPRPTPLMGEPRRDCREARRLVQLERQPSLWRLLGLLAARRGA